MSDKFQLTASEWRTLLDSAGNVLSDEERKIAESILEIFRKRNTLDILSKKALYIYVHEMADVPTPLITLIIKKLKVIYKKILNKKLEVGV